MRKPTDRCFNRFPCCVLRAKEEAEECWETIENENFLHRAYYVYRRCGTLLLCPGISRLSLSPPALAMHVPNTITTRPENLRNETQFLAVVIGFPFSGIFSHLPTP